MGYLVQINLTPFRKNMNSIYSIFTLLCVLQRVLQTNGAGNDLQVVYAVNCGGQSHTDKNGIHYEADPLHNKIGTASDYGNNLLTIGRVHEKDEVLYRTERYHTDTFGYDIPIDGDGEYALILKFCEVYFNEPNMKVFDVVLNHHHTIVTELDIFHQVGRGTAHEEFVYFSITNGRLYYRDEDSYIPHDNIRVEFVKSVYDNPKINAFVLFKGDIEKIPRLLPANLPTDIAADGSVLETASKNVHKSSQSNNEDGEGSKTAKIRKTSGPRQPNPYTMDDSSLMLPVFIAIGAFIPLLFCLCKL